MLGSDLGELDALRDGVRNCESGGAEPLELVLRIPRTRLSSAESVRPRRWGIHAPTVSTNLRLLVVQELEHTTAARPVPVSVDRGFIEKNCVAVTHAEGQLGWRLMDGHRAEETDADA